MKSQYRGRDCLKGGLGKFADWRGEGLGKKEKGGVFEGGGDTLMHTMHSDLSTLYNICTPWKFTSGEGNMIFCCVGRPENYFVSVSHQNNYIDPKFQGTFKNNSHHQGKETCAIFGFPINNKNSLREIICYLSFLILTS